ncbi:alcohol dehydrogenase, zinc-dependent [Catenaria anguillulae PL171]|uniref:Alcohol dehydrogenase, zinc-dependent n=1 Tax=Catenaria anguillulae PL171 TaxID=765915 RepID=A0A1Y2HIP1_9FUNG|nr:alcohol dehydrogenase, zinc-dependent [Catenaria anguillulae PL171]
MTTPTIPTTMRAISLPAYGGPEVLVVAADHPVPKPKPNQVLVRVIAAAVNAADWHIMRGDPKAARLAFGLTRPSPGTVLGNDFAGTIVAVGEKVKDWSIGDSVWGAVTPGAYAEYVAVPETDIARVPKGWTYAEAATLSTAGITAVGAVRDNAQVKDGDHVLVNGASSGVGMFAVQIAKAFGAARVVGVCSGKNAAMVSGLGADSIIDYTQESCVAVPAQKPADWKPYDSVVDIIGNHPYAKYRPLLASKGKWVSVGGPGGGLLGHTSTALGNMLGSTFSSQKAVMCTGFTNQKDTLFLEKLANEGKIRTVIQKRYPLDQTPEAIKVLETGRIAGKIVIEVDKARVDEKPYPA